MTKAHIDPTIELIHILDQLTYPKHRDDIVEAVRTAGSGDAVVTLISVLPQGTYTSSQAVREKLSKKQ